MTKIAKNKINYPDDINKTKVSSCQSTCLYMSRINEYCGFQLSDVDIFKIDEENKKQGILFVYQNEESPLKFDMNDCIRYELK